MSNFEYDINEIKNSLNDISFNVYRSKSKSLRQCAEDNIYKNIELCVASLEGNYNCYLEKRDRYNHKEQKFFPIECWIKNGCRRKIYNKEEDYKNYTEEQWEHLQDIIAHSYEDVQCNYIFRYPLAWRELYEKGLL